MSKIWDLALRGIDEVKRDVTLTYLVQSKEKITATDLDSLIKEAESPNVLDNLTLSARQGDPHRDVFIQIGPGRDTLVTVEAEDHTWAIGRHTEIMEALNTTRRRYTPGKPPKYVSWPTSWAKEQTTGKRTAAPFLSWAGGLIVSIAMGTLLLFYAILLVEPPVILIQRAVTHQPINTITKVFAFVSFALICATLYFVAAAFFASQSKVIIHERTFWTKNRIAGAGVIAAAVSAIAAVLALLR
jgi:hypothetical protein